jgi:hypothetical protein
VSEKDGTFEVVAKAGGIWKFLMYFFGIMLGEKFFGTTDLLMDKSCLIFSKSDFCFSEYLIKFDNS